MIYLDANATEPLRPEARVAMEQAMAITGNPSSIHGAGRAARRVVEDAREAVAKRCGVAPAAVVFTSGGTEADALAIHALGRDRRLIIGATEHDAVRAAAYGAEIIPVDASGVADMAALEQMLRGSPALVCLMLANNETGTVQPVAEVAALCRAAGALLHVDAAQACGRMAMDMVALGADSLALSAHKMGGPAGVGALLVAPHVAPHPLLRGGGQERGWRGGTAPMMAIAGFGAVARLAPVEMSALRDRLESLADGAVVIGRDAPRLGNTSCLALPGVAAQTQVMSLDLAGIAVSAGAACSSGKVVRSHVLDAMGLGSLAGEAIRVSLPWNATEADVDGFGHAWRAMAARLLQRAA